MAGGAARKRLNPMFDRAQGNRDWPPVVAVGTQAWQRDKQLIACAPTLSCGAYFIGDRVATGVSFGGK
jgi:hypothetical protein